MIFILLRTHNEKPVERSFSKACETRSHSQRLAFMQKSCGHIHPYPPGFLSDQKLFNQSSLNFCDFKHTYLKRLSFKTESLSIEVSLLPW